MSHQSRRILPAGGTRKRKEREREMEMEMFYSSAKPDKPTSSSAQAKPAEVEPMSSNRLLAGYMAYEFLTRGTLLGQKFEPGRVKAVCGSSEPRKGKVNEKKAEQKKYEEVASLMKTDGAHIPGIVNPTQLARWIQM